MKKTMKIILIIIFINLIKNDIITNEYDPYCSVSIKTETFNKKMKLYQELKKEYDDIIIDEDEINIIVTKNEFLKISQKYPEIKIKEYAKTRPPQGYKDLKEVENTLIETTKKYPNITKLIDVTKIFLGRQTLFNNSIYALKISSNPHIEQDKPNILMIATHHCRETVLFF
jgi:hypothetical protein